MIKESHGLLSARFEKSKPILVICLAILGILSSFVTMDTLMLPTTNIHDTILSYGKIYHTRNTKFGQSTTFFGYKYFTTNGFEFITDKVYIEDPQIKIEHSLIFKNVLGVSNQERDFTKKLISGLNDGHIYYYLIMTISTFISICILVFKKYISNNEYLNIILFNLFLLFCVLIIWWTFN